MREVVRYRLLWMLFWALTVVGLVGAYAVYRFLIWLAA